MAVILAWFGLLSPLACWGCYHLGRLIERERAMSPMARARREQRRHPERGVDLTRRH